MLSSVLGTAGHSATIPIPSGQATPATSTNSFALQLAAAIQGYLNQSANGSGLKIEIQAEPGQNPGSRQFIVTVKEPGSGPSGSATVSPKTTSPPATSTPAAPSAPPKTTTTPPVRTLMDLITPTTPGVKPAPSVPIVTPSDAYWAMQPPAVQALRNTPEDQRLALAQQLAQQGYAIDVPIMVWGWDPLVTMSVRRDMGYTWVPSALQKPVSVVPGVSFPGSPSYDPNNAPPGSIQVTTDFASNANSPDPWMKN
jgi:hypothetical protein